MDILVYEGHNLHQIKEVKNYNNLDEIFDNTSFTLPEDVYVMTISKVDSPTSANFTDIFTFLLLNNNINDLLNDLFMDVSMNKITNNKKLNALNFLIYKLKLYFNFQNNFNKLINYKFEDGYINNLDKKYINLIKSFKDMKNTKDIKNLTSELDINYIKNKLRFDLASLKLKTDMFKNINNSIFNLINIEDIIFNSFILFMYKYHLINYDNEGWKSQLISFIISYKFTEYILKEIMGKNINDFSNVDLKSLFLDNPDLILIFGTYLDNFYNIVDISIKIGIPKNRIKNLSMSNLPINSRIFEKDILFNPKKKIYITDKKIKKKLINFYKQNKHKYLKNNIYIKSNEVLNILEIEKLKFIHNINPDILFLNSKEICFYKVMQKDDTILSEYVFNTLEQYIKNNSDFEEKYINGSPIYIKKNILSNYFKDNIYILKDDILLMPYVNSFFYGITKLDDYINLKDEDNTFTIPYHYGYNLKKQISLSKSEKSNYLAGSPNFFNLDDMIQILKQPNKKLFLLVTGCGVFSDELNEVLFNFANNHLQDNNGKSKHFILRKKFIEKVDNLNLYNFNLLHKNLINLKQLNTEINELEQKKDNITGNYRESKIKGIQKNIDQLNLNYNLLRENLYKRKYKIDYKN